MKRAFGIFALCGGLFAIALLKDSETFQAVFFVGMCVSAFFGVRAQIQHDRMEAEN